MAPCSKFLRHVIKHWFGASKNVSSKATPSLAATSCGHRAVQVDTNESNELLQIRMQHSNIEHAGRRFQHWIYIYIYIVVFGHNQLAEMELRPLKLWVRRYHMKSHWRQRLLLTYPHSSKTTSPFGTQVEALTLTVVGPSCRRRCPQLFYNTSFSPLRPPVSFVDRFPGKEPQKMSHSSSG